MVEIQQTGGGVEAGKEGAQGKDVASVNTSIWKSVLLALLFYG